MSDIPESKDIPDMVLDFYGAKIQADAWRAGQEEATQPDDEYRAVTEDQRADNLLRDITLEWEALDADRELLTRLLDAMVIHRGDLMVPNGGLISCKDGDKRAAIERWLASSVTKRSGQHHNQEKP